MSGEGPSTDRAKAMAVRLVWELQLPLVSMQQSSVSEEARCPPPPADWLPAD